MSKQLISRSMVFRHLTLMILALTTAIGLGGCGKKSADAEKPAAEVQETVTMPSDPADTPAWKKYLASIVMQNMQGVKTNRPYMYFIPAGDSEKAVSDRANQLENVRGVVSRGVLPGNMMAFGGPDPKITADFAVQSFENAGAGTFKDVVVLIVGNPADADRVKAALTPSGAEVRFSEMK